MNESTQYALAIISLVGNFIAVVACSGIFFVAKSRQTAEREYRDRIDKELADIRRKNELLGYDIQGNRIAIAEFCGRTGQGVPRFRTEGD